VDELEAENRRLAAELEALRAAAAASEPGDAAASDAGGAAAGAAGGAAGAPRPRQPAGAEVLALNISGREVWARRSALAHLPGRLRDVFGGGGVEAPPCDVWGRPYL
jgi:hypothetical protein